MLVEGARSLPCRFRPAIAHNCRAYCGQVTTDRVWMERERERRRDETDARRQSTEETREVEGAARSRPTACPTVACQARLRAAAYLRRVLARGDLRP